MCSKSRFEMQLSSNLREIDNRKGERRQKNGPKEGWWQSVSFNVGMGVGGMGRRGGGGRVEVVGECIWTKGRLGHCVSSWKTRAPSMPGE